MKRYDLRKYKAGFDKRLFEILKNTPKGEVALFLFEKTTNERLKEVFEKIQEAGDEVLNSLKFNEADWTMAVRISDA